MVLSKRAIQKVSCFGGGVETFSKMLKRNRVRGSDAPKSVCGNKINNKYKFLPIMKSLITLQKKL